MCNMFVLLQKKKHEQNGEVVSSIPVAEIDLTVPLHVPGETNKCIQMFVVHVGVFHKEV